MKVQRAFFGVWGSYFLLAFLLSARFSSAQDGVKIGVATPMSGDFAILGRNIIKTVETYKRHYLRHPLKFTAEDAKISSVDGLTAYQKLINVDHVDLLIGATSSNGTIAAKSIVNSARIPLLSPLTGGSNIDRAGEYFFRVSTSDIKNGTEQAQLLSARGLKRVALFTEETEYTSDISEHFRKRFAELGGQIVFDQNFEPGNSDFRSIITKLRESKPDALFMSTQSGPPLGVFLKQLKQQGDLPNVKIFTNFVAAANPDARTIAGEAILGIEYLAPAYAADSAKWQEFLAFFRADHGADPDIAFHSASLVDSLNWLQSYLDENKGYSRTGFHDWLLQRVKNYDGLMGRYSLDGEGNSDLGFVPAVIK